MKRKRVQWRERRNSYENEIGGRKYIVVSHYAGGKEIDSTIRSLAIDRAKREMGIS